MKINLKLDFSWLRVSSDGLMINVVPYCLIRVLNKVTIGKALRCTLNSLTQGNLHLRGQHAKQTFVKPTSADLLLNLWWSQETVYLCKQRKTHELFIKNIYKYLDISSMSLSSVWLCYNRYFFNDFSCFQTQFDDITLKCFVMERNSWIFQTSIIAQLDST